MRTIPAFPVRMYRSIPCQPYEKSWILSVLQPFSEYYLGMMEHPTFQSETVLKRARENLLELVMPFVMNEAQRKCYNLPHHADTQAMISAHTEGARVACGKFEPERFISWPALLKQKLEFAPTESARSDSGGRSRLQVKLSGRLAAAEEDAVQRLGRSLTQAEQDALAAELAPDTKRTSWSTDVRRSNYFVPIDPTTQEGIDLPDLHPEAYVDEMVSAQALVEALDEVAQQLPPEYRELFFEELERCRQGKEPRKAVANRLRRYFPPRLQAFLITTDIDVVVERREREG